MTVTRKHHLIDRMLDVRVGDTLTFVVLRGDTEQTVSVTITEADMTAY